MMTEGETGTNGIAAAGAEGEEKCDLTLKIVQQIQYYFGDYNLPRDKFLKQELKTDEGWIQLDTMLKFKRLANISSDKAVLMAALKDSSDTFMEVDESNEKIRRSPSHPLPEQNEEELREKALKRTVYCKGFPKDEDSPTLDLLLTYFKQYGPYETVLPLDHVLANPMDLMHPVIRPEFEGRKKRGRPSKRRREMMRYFYSKEDKRQGFKGSVLVVFETEEKAKEFMELPKVIYDGGHDILRKWHADYIEDKKKEIEERKARKEDRKKKVVEKEQAETLEEIEMPKGTFLHFSGLEGGEASREDVKAAMGDEIDKVAWVDYCRGMKEGYLRFKDENSNKAILEKLGSKIKVKDIEVELRMVEGEEEEKQLKKMQEARTRARVNSTGGKKRRGGGRGGPHFKKRRT